MPVNFQRCLLHPKAYIPLRCKIPGVRGWHWAMPLTPEFCIGDTNMLVSWSQRKPFFPDAKLKICVSPNAKPHREPMEYRLRWVPNAKILHWPCTFNVFCVDFICVWYPTQTQFPVKYGLKVTISYPLRIHCCCFEFHLIFCIVTYLILSFYRPKRVIGSLTNVKLNKKSIRLTNIQRSP